MESLLHVNYAVHTNSGVRTSTNLSSLKVLAVYQIAWQSTDHTTRSRVLSLRLLTGFQGFQESLPSGSLVTCEIGARDAPDSRGPNSQKGYSRINHVRE